jgi:hypothetical protein
MVTAKKYFDHRVDTKSEVVRMHGFPGSWGVGGKTERGAEGAEATLIWFESEPGLKKGS